MSLLTRVRPSNLIILFSLPFIIWLFATSADYSRSLWAIVGIEKGSSAFLPGFLLAICASGSAVLAVWIRRPRVSTLLAFLTISCGAFLAISDAGLPFAGSVVANAVDPFTSPLVVAGQTPRRLTDQATSDLAALLPPAIAGWTGVAAFFLALSRVAGPVGCWARRGVIALAGVPLAYLLLVAYLGFAAGVATSIRAAITAYVLAVALALFWVGLLQLRLTQRSGVIFAGLVMLFVALAGWQFLQPKSAYALVGSADGQSGAIGVVKDTPASLISAVRYGAYPGAPPTEAKLKSFADAESALSALSAGQGVAAVLVPAGAAAGLEPALWQAEALADGNRAIGAMFSVLAVICGLLLIGGLAHRRHPLSVGAEFVIDTIRGIPMLVIVLYIGLPLSGAVKEASGGFIDPPNLLRGILAMALAYSAYLAEIIRAGINAVPVGQIEAARSLGLTRWQTARHVILPQAFRIIIPPLGNEFIAILKDTSLLSILSIRDITQRMREFQSASFLPFAPYNSAAIFYVLLTLIAASLVASVERKYHVARR